MNDPVIAATAFVAVLGFVVAVSLVMIRRSRQTESDRGWRGDELDPEVVGKRKFRRSGEGVVRIFMATKIRARVDSSQDDLEKMELQLLYMLFLEHFEFSELQGYMDATFGFCPGQASFVQEVKGEDPLEMPPAEDGPAGDLCLD
jgi:hypothetical protein